MAALPDQRLQVGQRSLSEEMMNCEEKDVHQHALCPPSEAPRRQAKRPGRRYSMCIGAMRFEHHPSHFGPRGGAICVMWPPKFPLVHEGT